MPAVGRFSHGPDPGLPQRVALGVLLRSFPPPQVDRVLDAAGRREQRQRLLPARLVVYFTLGMWIFNALSYERILAEIVRAVPGLALPVAPGEQASAAAIGRARKRLGVEPLRLLFEQAAGSPTSPELAASSASPVRPCGLRPLRLGRVQVAVPATPANLLGFGDALARPASAASAGVRPPRRPPVVDLRLYTEVGTERVVAAEIAGTTAAPSGRPAAASLPPGSLLILDEPPPATASAPVSMSAGTACGLGLGAELLWRLDEREPPPHGTRLPDGSTLCVLPVEGTERTVRVVPHTKGALATSVLDHRTAPAAELAAIYDERLSDSCEFNGFGAYGGGERLSLRSKDPEMVRQELYAMLCVHHAIGDLVGPVW